LCQTKILNKLVFIAYLLDISH